MITKVLVITLLYLTVCKAQRNVFGSCPTVAPLKEFDIAKFEGRWYVIQLFDNRVKCMEWNIKEEDGLWRITETKDSGAIKTYNGKLFPSESNDGDLRVSWSLNIGGSYPFTVFATDYDNYAGIFMCQRVLFYSRQQAVLLSRTPTLPSDTRQTLAGTLARYDISMEYFMRVDQSHCNRVTSESSGENVEGNEDDPLKKIEGVLPNGAGDFGGIFVGLNEDAEFA